MKSGKEGKNRPISFSESETTCLSDQALEAGFTSAEEYLLYLHEHYGTCVSKPPKTNTRNGSGSDRPSVEFKTKFGRIYRGDSATLMRSVLKSGSMDLVVTSPPFGLLKKKSYGNEDADQYLKWFRPFAIGMKRVLKDSGSLVIDIGGAWQKGKPVRSLYHFELLLMLCREYGFNLVQEFYWWNPARLPGPAEWTNIRRIRVKDAVNCVWWLSLDPYPKASNRRVLQPYSSSMKKLLRDGYTPGLRPSGHNISDKFSRKNAGAIPPNLIALANTESNSNYHRYCREKELIEHPARFPIGLPSFFIRMLTDKGDRVLDPFGGSCVTGEAAERSQRRWVCCELNADYVEGAKGRFTKNGNDNNQILKRVEPYKIYPPSSGLLEEEEAPLLKDGGRKRPKFRKRR